jgi:hypothetical protein
MNFWGKGEKKKEREIKIHSTTMSWEDYVTMCMSADKL